MRIPLMVFLLAAAIAPAGADSDLQGQLDLARKEGDTPARIELLRRWLDIHPDDPGAVSELVSQWLRLPDFDMAERALTQATDPGLVARTHAEVALRRAEKIQDALAILRQRAEVAPKDRASRLLLAEYLGRADERPEQIAVLDGLIAEQSQVGLLMDRADAKLATEDADGALADFRRAAAAGPDTKRVRREHPKFERLEVAVAEIAKLEKLPPSPQVDFTKSYFFLWGGLPNRGLAEMKTGRRVWPDSVYAQILEARALVALGQLTAQKALEDRLVDVNAWEEEKARNGILRAEAALAKNPDDKKSCLARATWLHEAGQEALARKDAESVLESEPASIPALHLAAAIALRQDDLSAATAYARKLQSLKAPREVLADVYAGLAEKAFAQSKIPLALDFAAQSLDAKPTARAWKVKSASHTRLGQTEEAAAALQQAEKGAK